MLERAPRGEMEHPHIFGRSDGYIGLWVLNLLTYTGHMADTVPDTVQWCQGFEIYTYTMMDYYLIISHGHGVRQQHLRLK